MKRIRSVGRRRRVADEYRIRVRHDELVRRYVEEHGSISRKETAELCAVTAPQAHQLLKNMASDRILRRVGSTGRGARYERNA